MTDTPQTTAIPSPPATTTPGYRTTEFWMKLAAIALTALFASGAIPTTGTAATVTAIAATMLGALGYTVSRSLVKTGAAALLLVLALAGTGASLTACATTGATVKAEVKTLEGCSAADAVAIVAATSKIIDDAKAPDRLAAAIDVIGQLATMHAAWGRCKGVVPPPVPAAPTARTVAQRERLFCGTGCMGDSQCSEGTACSKCVGNTCTTEQPLAPEPDRVAGR